VDSQLGLVPESAQNGKCRLVTISQRRGHLEVDEQAALFNVQVVGKFMAATEQRITHDD